jgi:hypothetical protein
MATAANPYTMMIADTENTISMLGELSANMELAIEEKSTSQRVYNSSKAEYEDAEALFIFELMMNDHQYQSAKNAEAREAIKDMKLIWARKNSTLATPWTLMIDSKHHLDIMTTNLEQTEIKWKAVREIAQLRAAMLMASVRN